MKWGGGKVIIIFFFLEMYKKPSRSANKPSAWWYEDILSNPKSVHTNKQNKKKLDPVGPEIS